MCCKRTFRFNSCLNKLPHLFTRTYFSLSRMSNIMIFRNIWLCVSFPLFVRDTIKKKPANKRIFIPNKMPFFFIDAKKKRWFQKYYNQKMVKHHYHNYNYHRTITVMCCCVVGSFKNFAKNLQLRKICSLFFQ